MVPGPKELGESQNNSPRRKAFGALLPSHFTDEGPDRKGVLISLYLALFQGSGKGMGLRLAL